MSRESFRAGRERLCGWRGGARAGGEQALRQDRAIDGREGFLGQEANSMSAPDRRAMVERLARPRRCAGNASC
jgi:hypothetical protein